MGTKLIERRAWPSCTFILIKGDDDPIDICDLTQHSKQPGDVFRGKVLGSFCLIDQGEIDWKIFVID